MGWHTADQPIMEYSGVRCGGRCADGTVGEEEGEQVSQRARREVQEEAVFDDTWCLVADEAWAPRHS